MWGRPNFIVGSGTAKKLSATNPVPPDAMFNVHEEPTQDIQGGSPGEHYHITEAELDFLQAQMATPPVVYEPVCEDGEALFDDSGDILMHPVSYTQKAKIMLHKDSSDGNIHSVANWVVVDNLARDALVVVADDIGKFVWVTGDDAFYVLKDDSPMHWVSVGSAGSAGVFTPAFAVRRITSTFALGGSPAKLQFNSEELDNANCYDSATNHRFTPNVEGWYQIQWTVSISGSGSGNTFYSYIEKNGSIHAYGSGAWPANNVLGLTSGACLVFFDGLTDYIELFGASNNSSLVMNINSVFSGYLVKSTA